MNIYIDPFSYIFLSNKLFIEDPSYNPPYDIEVLSYFKKYCLERNINLNTIDFWSEDKKTSEDIYVSLEHKDLFRKIYWRFKNRNYQIFKLNDFKKRILFQSEPPTVLPEVYGNINSLFKIYDKAYFSCKLNDPRCHYFHIPQPYNKIFAEYWENSDRKFLVMINKNKKKRLSRQLLILANRKRLPFQRELLGDRIEIIEFFSRTREIDLYGVDWNKYPPFPYWFYKSALQKVYHGKVKSKHQKLSEYNFAIAFENNIGQGFIGEAIFDCFYVGTVPIYLGAPDIQEYIPKECFIDMRDFKDYEELRLFLKSLKKSQIQSYKENARQFLESEQYKPFTKEYFAEIFIAACRNE